jgi:hypothetical protein
MLASQCDRQDSQRKWQKHGCLRGVEYYNFNIVFPFLKMYTQFKKEKNYIKILILTSSNDNRASVIFFDCPACRMVMLAFIRLKPSFERTSYYTLLP